MSGQVATVLAATYSALIVAGLAVTLVALARYLLESRRAAPARSDQVIGVLRARRAASDRGEPWPTEALPRSRTPGQTAALGYFGLALSADWLTQLVVRRTGPLAETGFRGVLDAMVVTSVELLVLRRARSGAVARDGLPGSGWWPLGAAIALGIAGAATVGL